MNPTPPSDAPTPTLLLLDNGSLEPAAVLSLRAIAARLSAALGQEVAPVSLLHSHKIPAERLDGRPAEIFDQALARRIAAGAMDFLVVPLFFGPSGALTDYLPQRVARLRALHPDLRVRLAPPLADVPAAADTRLAAILADHVRAKLTPAAPAPAVIVVDHGSPVREVTAVRDHVTAQLRELLGATVRAVSAASMERRPEPEYAFNEPLLATALDRAATEAGRVIVAPLFLSPGRHAGPGGDIAQICAAAQARHPGLQPILTELVGTHAGLIAILAERAQGEGRDL
ncbi:MAG: cobalamin biosynthesis protein CbiX [Opitutae bacterium]|nr:cobalamin biosynthesis protein CbiX [Opitutae bacterium]